MSSAPFFRHKKPSAISTRNSHALPEPLQQSNKIKKTQTHCHAAIQCEKLRAAQTHRTALKKPRSAKNKKFANPNPAQRRPNCPHNKTQHIVANPKLLMPNPKLNPNLRVFSSPIPIHTPTKSGNSLIVRWTSLTTAKNALFSASLANSTRAPLTTFLLSTSLLLFFHFTPLPVYCYLDQLASSPRLRIAPSPIAPTS